MRETVTCVLAALAALAAVLQMSGKCPSGVASFILAVIALLSCMPK